MKFFLLCLFYSVQLFASDYHCASDHINDAIEINREHRSLYKNGNDKEAARVINRLIFIEKIMHPFSISLDRSAEKLIDNGLAMWCEDFVSMDSLPDFQLTGPIPTKAFIPFDKVKLKQIRKKIKSFEMSQASKLYSEIVAIIEIDLEDKNYNCVTKHFLESTARSLKLAMQRNESIALENKKDFLKATKKMMKQMSLALLVAPSLDRMAAKVQMRGVPVLCQEMPLIPY
ncbi:MAG: hypothetical protein COW01_11915 [Bdellovibrionales bacterium CG12_big_fil_rev_8_21_14_0_65_38_15]|nr:MAG: hypothetical protein COW79_01325 [Bdellovibrionales bacterium CG22_combo_CG10-13_8_21_14_all_38_13]PIQ54039.1 MAG: hypothetical protein COW01_11915 [Bdellovibrionales bacterium CG12_big_fil_rev_8_21_14_0_65_38_15]PIR28564.1 MAG: hypothetical protein COV38_14915 [Bdellovibrionales bacterium CG11_big_fil_rev_8_21_14_0_20_38_13]